MLTRLTSTATVAAVLVMTAVALLAQSKAPAPGSVALSGYCPVAYVAMNNRAVRDPL